jgi:hypothetical protein
MKQNQEPSMKRLAIATIFALVLAGIILVVAVLPAEYGIDPLGTGAALGLTALSEGADQAPLDLKALAEAKPTPIGNKQLQTPPVLADWDRNQDARYKVDSRKIELKPGGKLEFKYQMRKGANLVYAWESTGKVKYEFHGEPNAGPSGTYQSYAIDNAEGVDRRYGSFTAPFSGIHGWYWENASQSPVTIQLLSAGFYSNAEEFLESGHNSVQLEDVR